MDRRYFLKTALRNSLLGAASSISVSRHCLSNSSDNILIWPIKLNGAKGFIFRVGRFEMGVDTLIPNFNTENLTDFFLNSIYLEIADKRIIIEPVGSKIGENGLLDALKSVNISPDTIDAIFITHAHSDHYFGLFDRFGSLVFRNAELYMHAHEWKYWEKVSDAEKVHRDNFINHLLPLKKSFKLYELDGEIIPGISAMLTPGHSPGHATIHVNNALSYSGDTLLQPMHISHPENTTTWVLDKNNAIVSRQKYLYRVSHEKSVVVTTHFNHPIGRVAKRESRYIWLPVYSMA